MKLSTRLTIAMVGLACLTATAIGFIAYRSVVELAMPRALERLRIHSRLLALDLESSRRGDRYVVLGLAVSSSLGEFIREQEGGENNTDSPSRKLTREYLAHQFVAALTPRSDYLAISLVGLDDNGREIVRVERAHWNEAARIVPDIELERRADSDFFRRAMELPAGEVYVAPIYLQSQQSPVKMLRLAAPVRRPDGRTFGILVTEIDMDSAFAHIRHGAPQGAQAFVLNEEGDYLLHPDMSKELGFGPKQPARLRDQFPDLARMLSSDMQPPRLIKSSTGEIFGVAVDTIRLAGGPRILIIETMTYRHIVAGAAAVRDISLFGGFVAMVGAVLLAMLIARSLARPLVEVTNAVAAFDGHHAITIPTGASGEIGILACAFAGMATQVRDKTAALLTEIAQRQHAEETARDVIDTALDAFIQVDENSIIRDWNPQAEAIFGWSRGEAIGQNYITLVIAPEDRAYYAERMVRLVRLVRSARRPNFKVRFQSERMRRDGRKIVVDVAATGVCRGSSVMFNGFMRDITQKIVAEHKLRQSQKMEAVGQLTGGIAHDFNNMLTVITGTIDMLAAEVTHKPQLAAVARLISEAADRGAELTSRLLVFAREQPLRPQDTDINALMMETERLLRPTVGARVEIDLALTTNEMRTLVDPTLLTTAIVNLAVNARDAMPNGGRMTFEIGHVVFEEEGACGLAEMPAGSYVRIAVSDSGFGIPEAIRDRIFEPFFTTKEIGKGTGLGLSMVYGFVKQSGGYVTIKSEEHRGTTIALYLPLVKSEAKSPIIEATDACMELGQETILIVEDDATVRRFVASQIESLGYRTLTAAGAAEALAMVEGGIQFDLLFTDMMMPGPMNGIQLAEEVARRRANLRVLFTTGYADNAKDLFRQINIGRRVIAKPYRRSKLSAMIRGVLDEATAHPHDSVAQKLAAIS